MNSLLNKYLLSICKKVSYAVGRNKSQNTTILSQFTEINPEKKQASQPIANGRCWRAQELRLKSNQDIHKLWYVCVKEKNILLADRVVNLKITHKDLSKFRILKLKKTMKRILSVVGQREKIRAQYRRQLEDQYVLMKKKELEQRIAQQPEPLPQISAQMLRNKYHQLRKGIDNVQYLERICKNSDIIGQKQQNYKMRKERMQKRLSQPQKQFQSYFEKEISFEEKPMQEEILRSHIKNWKMLNFKQRKIILGFLNARRAKDAKSAFLKQLKILGQHVARQQISNRIKS